MIFLARNRLRALIILIFAHDMQIHVAHALCKQGCRLISYTVNIRLVTIAVCYNCPRSPLHPVYVMKEIINRYQRLGSSVYLCFLDAFKAFDHINHDTLLKKLVNRNVPAYIVRLLVFWYSHQQMFVKWGNVTSSDFTVSNGMRQGGVLSPYLFNVYMDGLSTMLNTCETGCYSGVSKVNHLMYADDLVLLSPCTIGLSRLLKCCDDYAVSHDMVYNG